MKDIKGTTKDFEDWTPIQTRKENTMQFKHFVASNPHTELFNAQGVRKMRIQKVKDQDGLKNFKTVMEWFGENLKVASDIVMYNPRIQENYEFPGHNFLANQGPVTEQSIHTDYYFIIPCSDTSGNENIQIIDGHEVIISQSEEV